MSDAQGPKVIVNAFFENRAMSAFMRNAGLGITGAGSWELINIAFKPGEVVDEQRIHAMMKSLREISDSEKTEQVITDYKILSISP